MLLAVVEGTTEVVMQAILMPAASPFARLRGCGFRGSRAK